MFLNFIQDKFAKTPSFFMPDMLGGVCAEDIEKLVKLGNKTKETARLCLHSSPDDALQVMLIYHPVKKNIDIKKYLSQDSIYMVLEGFARISFFGDDMTLTNTIELSPKHNILFKIPHGQLYKFDIVSESILFLEIRNGPFKREEQIIFKDAKYE